MPEAVVCSCAACREMFAPGRILLSVFRNAAVTLQTTGLTGRAKRHSRLAMWVWAMRRTKQKIQPKLRIRTVYLTVFNDLARPEYVKAAYAALHLNTAAEATLEHIKVKRVRKYVAARLGFTVCTHCYNNKAACGCWKCTACSTHFSRDVAACATCRKCSECCECVECAGCGRRLPASHFCADCNRCRNCDPCRRDREEIPWTERNGRRSKLKYHGEPTPRFPRYIGVEIECGTGEIDNVNYKPLGSALTKWSSSCHGDGSIRLPGPIEVSTSPSRGEAFEQQITEVCDALQACGGRVDRSCGLHVHVDARDLTHKQVLGVTRLYTKVEQALYEVVAPSRRGVSYAKPWGKHFEAYGVFGEGTPKERMDKLEGALYGTPDQVKYVKSNLFKHDARYHGLNLNALLLYGTIEFRLHQGTVNAKKIMMWSAVCSALVERATKLDEVEIQNLVGSPMEILIDALGDDAALKDWIDDRRAHFIKTDKLREGKINKSNVSPVEASER